MFPFFFGYKLKPTRCIRVCLANQNGFVGFEEYNNDKSESVEGEVQNMFTEYVKCHPVHATGVTV